MKGRQVALIAVGVVAVGAIGYVVYSRTHSPVAARQVPPAPSPTSGGLGFNIASLNALANDAASLYNTFSGGAPKPTTPSQVASAGYAV